jgi:pimeloyl-ACP methyl ester carboxylesterase
VLVHGAWLGGWSWSRVAPPLVAAGHRVFAPSLAGLGDRASVDAATITLDTHVDDVVTLIEREQLDEVVLVGHSYGGVVISAVAERIAPRIAHLAYVDAIVLKDGESWADTEPPASRARRLEAARQHGMTWPVPKAAALGIATASDQAWAQPQLRPQPHGPYDGKVRVGAAWRGIEKTYIAAVKPVFAPVARYHQATRDIAGWNYADVPSGHCAMIDAPGPLADILVGLS